MNSIIDKRIFEILLVEDNQADVRLIKEVLKDFVIEKNITVLTDGEQVSEYLLRKNEFFNRKMPDIILLDLNIPKKDGFEVLKEIKGSEEFKDIPVIIISSSEAEESVIKAYKSGANCYIVKPLRLDEFIRVIRGIEEFWLNTVRLQKK